MYHYDLLTKCVKPILVRPHGSEEPIVTSCGHCPACVAAKRSTWAQRMETEASKAASVLFFSLTYDNENLPIYTFDSDSQSFIHNKYPENHELYSISFSFIDSQLGDASLYHPTDHPSVAPCFGVVHKPDVQKFFKRLRKNVDTDPLKLLSGVPDSCKDIRYFVASEYGPKTLRPHYHGILYLKSKVVSKAILKHYFHKSWKLGAPERCEISEVITTASQYVSKYLHKDGDLPTFLTVDKFTRNFYLCSRRPIFGYNDVSSSDLVDRTKNRNLIVDRSFIDCRSGDFIDLKTPVSAFCRNFYFPKLAFSSLAESSEVLRYLRTVFNHASQVLKSIPSEEIDYSYKSLYKVISLSFPNHCRSIFDSIEQRNDYLRQSCTHFEKVTLSSLVNDLPFDYFFFGVPTNRRFLVRAVILMITENITPNDYYELWKSLYSQSTSINLARTYSFWESRISEGFNPLETAALCYPDFFCKLPSAIALHSDLFDLINLQCESLGISILSLYDDFVDTLGVLKIKFTDLTEFLSLHTQTSDHLSYVRQLTIDKTMLEIRREQLHEKYYF